MDIDQQKEKRIVALTTRIVEAHRHKAEILGEMERSLASLHLIKAKIEDLERVLSEYKKENQP